MKRGVYISSGKAFLLFIVMGICSFFNARAQSQDVSILVSITDPASTPLAVSSDRGQSKVVFRDAALNAIAANYTFHKFERAYPTAAESYLRNMWKIEVNSAKFLEDIKNYKPQTFAYTRIVEKGTPLFTPNDYGYVGSWNLQNELDLIHAKDAWDITHGDTSVIIGITDTYFDTTNPDLVGKFKRIRYNANNQGAGDHGTMVATLVAGGTNNGVGMSSIGYNCRLDVESALGADDEMLAMSSDGVRILNGSWYNNCYYDVIQQGVYNSIYENGTVTCFAAGNGSGTCGTTSSYAYPASYDHNISVTAVGNQFVRGTNNATYQNTQTGYSWFDVHEKYIGFPSTTYTHNNKVDIAAPGYGVSSGYYQAGNPGYQFQAYNGWGTSFASPIVAGTVGLMLSANKALSPYQVEYIMKKSAANIDTIAQNIPYAGQLGAGRLDAGAAVASAAGFNPNDAATASMFIAGIEITSRCMPGFSSNGTKPMLKPTIVNGTPPYTYKWEELPGNAAVLSAGNVANPTVNSMNTGTDVWFRLTVYDNSTIQKVASKVIHTTLNSNNNYDLAIRDSYNDVYDEVNLQDSTDNRDWNLWRSPDIWNRQQNDTLTFHQPAAYTAPNNYVSVRIHNVGCQPSTAANGSTTNRLKVYWSFPSTSLKWSSDFSNSFTYATNSGTIPCGGAINATPIVLGALQPGSDTVIKIAWNPVNYALAAPKAKEGNLSLCARISKFNNQGADMGLGSTEGNRTMVNARSFNNLALNNLVKISIDSNTLVNSSAVYFTNPDSVQQTMNFTLNHIKDVYKFMSGDFSRLLTCRIYLGASLYTRWVSGGREGKYRSYNDNLKFVEFDDISNAGIRNISMNPGEHAMVIVEVGVKNLPFVNVAPHLQEFMISQYKAITNERVGTVDFEVYYNSAVNTPTIYKTEVNNVTVAAQSKLNVYPNPANNGIIYAIFTGSNVTDASIRITDMTGRTVYTEEAGVLAAKQPKGIPVGNLSTGVYFLHITGKGNNMEPVKFVITQ